MIYISDNYDTISLSYTLEGGDNMDKKCFGISGNFEQYGRWSQPDPGFIGNIIVNEDGTFEGFMEEQYGSVDTLRFVAGIFLEKEAKLVYYKLGCSSRHAPLLYTFEDINEIGKWDALDFPKFKPGGIAKVKLEETDPAPHLAKIQETKEIIIKGPFWNEIFVNNMQEILQSALEKI